MEEISKEKEVTEIALNYYKEKAHADVLQLEVNSLSKELTFRRHASKGVPGNSKNPCARNEFMTFQLPSLLTISP